MKFSFYSLIFASVLLFSCTKQVDQTPIPLTNSLMLVGTGQFPTVWHLTQLTIDNVDQPLTYAQKIYTKSYAASGTFKSNDGFVGNWQFPTNTSLAETITNLPSGSNTTQTYQVISISTYKLTLQYTLNGTQIVTTYTAGN
jgi:hypothetical protein